MLLGPITRKGHTMSRNIRNACLVLVALLALGAAACNTSKTDTKNPIGLRTPLGGEGGGATGGGFGGTVPPTIATTPTSTGTTGTSEGPGSETPPPTEDNGGGGDNGGGNDNDGVGGALSEGAAHIELAGDVKETLDLPFSAGDSTVGSISGGALVWSDETSGSTLSIGGIFKEGATKTSPTFVLSIGLLSKGQVAVFVSLQGECTVNVDKAETKSVEGSFQCSGMTSSNLTADARGTFKAEG